MELCQLLEDDVSFFALWAGRFDLSMAENLRKMPPRYLTLVEAKKDVLHYKDRQRYRNSIIRIHFLQAVYKNCFLLLHIHISLWRILRYS